MCASNRCEGPSPSKYRADIDGLRGIAVLAVVLFHAFPRRLAGGFVGVDVFFVISGYLISGIILAELSEGRFSVFRFYERRVRRIFPALCVTLGACLVLGWFVLFPDEFSSLGGQTAGSAGFVANIVLWRQTGYFDQAADLKPLLHLWSLGVEEQFYLVWPLLLVLTWRTRYRWAALLLVLAGSFALNAWFVYRSPAATFYLPVTRLWELLIGAVVAFAHGESRAVGRGEKQSRRNPTASTVAMVSWGGLALLLLALVVIDRRDAVPGWWALLPTVGAALLITAGPSAPVNRHLLANRALVGVGLISYPLYLWHWPLLVYQRVLVERPDASSRVVVVFASVLLAWLTYRYVEHPVRTGPRRPAVLAALCVGLAVLGVSGWLAGNLTLQPLSARGELGRVWEAAADWHPFSPTVRMERFKSIRYRILGDDRKPHVLFLGDSHIEQLGPRIEEVLQSRPNSSRGVFVIVGGGCPPIPGVLETSHPVCGELLRDAFEFAKNDAVERVVIGACWKCYLRQAHTPEDQFSYYIDSGRRQVVLNSGPESDRLALSSLQSALAALSSLKPTYLVLNLPYDTLVDPKRMITRQPFGAGFVFTMPRFTKQAFLDGYADLRELLVKTATSADARIIDPLDTLCPDEECPVVDDGRLVYRDGSHLRPFYVREHATFVDAMITMP